MSSLNLDDDVQETSDALWICPECSSERTTIRYCDECNYFGLRRAINSEVENAKRDAHFGWLKGLGIVLAVGIVIWGFGYGGFSRLFGSSEGQANASASPTPTPSPSPPTEEQVRAFEAIKSFVTNKYPDWNLVGNNLDSTDLTVYGQIGFDIHLTKGNDNKVVSVILGEFKKEDGNKYWIAYPAPAATPSRPQTTDEP